MKITETRARSVFKSVTFRILATLTTVSLVWIFTGEIGLALGLGAIEIVLKFIIYYVHERVWGAVSWGVVHADERK